MPRVSIKKKDYIIKDFRMWLKEQMKEKKIRQKDIADWLDITQPAVSVKIDECNFTFQELVTIFDKLHTESDEIGTLFTF